MRFLPFLLSKLNMGYLHLSISGTDAADDITITGLKLARVSSDFAQADDLYTIACPSGTILRIDEAGGETAAWTTAGVAFSTTANEAFVLTEASLLAGFPALTQSLDEGLYCIEYNNDSADTLRPYLHIPTILDDIDTLAQSVIDCQCDCDITEAASQKYIKARAYLDLIEYQAAAITAAADITAINAMITKLKNFLVGTEKLCGSC